jgi:hypothetical protein
VFYVCKKDTGFEAIKQARACKNGFGLDLFIYRGLVYEGRSGSMVCRDNMLPDLYANLEKYGLEKFNKNIESLITYFGLGESPRYTKPNERKRDIFPDTVKENIVFAKDEYGKKHYYFRFHNENGVELFTLKNETESYQTVFVQCDGYMIGIGSKGSYESIAERVAGFENGIKGEVERIFNESMANPQKWADGFFAEILGRAEEAKAHNAPIREAREQENQRRDAEREAKRVAEEQAEKAEYEQAIKTAESKILNKETVSNTDIQGKSLVMQLFREHEIAVPLKTQGWIINAMHSIEYDADRDRWSYRYFNNSRDSTVFSDYLPLLVSAVQAKQQFEEMKQNGGDEPPPDSHIEEENEDDIEI